MPYSINEVPKRALRILLGRECKRTYNKEPNINFPNEILVVQDKDQEHFQVCFSKVLFPDVTMEMHQDDQYVNWQLRQVYKILNAVLNSIHSSVTNYKKELLELKNELEQSEYIKLWLKQIDDGVIPTDLIGTGHGKCRISDGYIKKFYGCELVLFNPIGSKMTRVFGGAIENDLFDQDCIYIDDEKNAHSFVPEVYEFPQFFNDSSNRKLPNMLLTTHGSLKAKIIESKTGRLLLDIKKEILLSDIFAKYPGRRFTWSACTVIKGASHSLGPNSQYLVNYTKNKDKLKRTRSEAVMRKLRSTSVKFTYDQNFVLFAENKRGRLNEAIAHECKRYKK